MFVRLWLRFTAIYALVPAAVFVAGYALGAFDLVSPDNKLLRSIGNIAGLLLFLGAVTLATTQGPGQHRSQIWMQIMIRRWKLAALMAVTATIIGLATMQAASLLVAGEFAEIGLPRLAVGAAVYTVLASFTLQHRLSQLVHRPYRPS